MQGSGRAKLFGDARTGDKVVSNRMTLNTAGCSGDNLVSLRAVSLHCGEHNLECAIVRDKGGRHKKLDY